jgi:hypothetical protein
MTVYLTPFILIGALVVLGILVGLGLVLLTVRRERRDVRAVGDKAAETRTGIGPPERRALLALHQPGTALCRLSAGSDRAAAFGWYARSGLDRATPR